MNTVEKALDLASRQWGVPAEELRSEVIGSEKVFLGLFGKKLKVEVTLPERSLLCKGRDFVDDLLKLMDLCADTVLRFGALARQSNSRADFSIPCLPVLQMT